MKRFIPAIITLSFIFLSARSDTGSYNRSLLYIGLASSADMELERIKKINTMILDDIKKRLAAGMKFTDLSGAYLYSQGADIPSIAKTSNVRWIMYGKTGPENKGDISIYLYDAEAGKDVESVSFTASEGESGKFKENIEYIYSKIAEANTFFIQNPPKTQAKLAPNKALLLSFDISQDTPSNFHRLRSVSGDTVFGKGKGSPETIPAEKIPFVLMRHRDYNSMKRIKTLGRLLDTRWFITGTLKKDAEAISCNMRLFDAERESIAGTIDIAASSYDAMEVLLRRRLQNFVLIVSEATDYRFFQTADFGAAEVKIAAGSPYTGSVFDSSGSMLSGHGTIVHLAQDLSQSGIIESMGEGIKKFTSSAGVQIDQQGRIYVMDTAEKKILQFYKDGSFLSEFFYGAAASGFVVTSGGYVFIHGSRKPLMIQIYTKEGSHIRDIQLDSGLSALCLFKGSPVLLSAADGFYTQTFFSQSGSVLQTRYLGLSSKTVSINAAAMDANENIYCTDTEKGIVLCISKNGNIMWIYKNLPSLNPDKFNAPFSVSADYMGNNVLIIDNNGRRLINLRKKNPQKNL
ncbi:MAG: hypothetical protein LBT84_01695 [Spirochaetia bacterium]|nr:hypothetical protein [Spirochaetia bacterium]